MFEDTSAIIKNINLKVDNILSVNYEDVTQKDIDAVLRNVVQEMLVEYGRQAAIATVEYAYPPLLERLEENLSNPEHVVVENGRVIKFFDEEIAGTAQDFYGGVEETGGHTGTAQAPAIWRYGIYTPASFWRGGKGSKVYKSLPSYEEVISERLDAWGDKAPYWYLIEHGNAGGGREFPTVRPTNFLKTLARAISKLQRIASDVIATLVTEFAETNVQPILVGEQAAGTTVAVARVTLPGIKLTKLRSSKGNTFYNLNGQRALTANEALSQIRALVGI